MSFFELRTNEPFEMVPINIKYEKVLDKLEMIEKNKSCGVNNLNPALLLLFD